MELYTGYFYKLQSYLQDGIIPIAICGKSPDDYTGMEYKKLAPKYHFYKKYKDGDIDSYAYTDYYYDEVLSTISPEEIVDDIQTLLEENGHTIDDETKVVLLCYESPRAFCHRHLVADYLTENTISVKEY